jgi:hypothetical protein
MVASPLRLTIFGVAFCIIAASSASSDECHQVQKGRRCISYGADVKRNDIISHTTREIKNRANRTTRTSKLSNSDNPREGSMGGNGLTRRRV